MVAGPPPLASTTTSLHPYIPTEGRSGAALCACVRARLYIVASRLHRGSFRLEWHALTVSCAAVAGQTFVRQVKVRGSLPARLILTK